LLAHDSPIRTLLLVALTLLASSAAYAEITIEWVTISDAGNPGDPDVTDNGQSGYGAVAHEYQIGKFEVTAGQYAAFLNAVAEDDPNGLWDPEMASLPPELGDVGPYLAIVRVGTPGSYGYGADMPVAHVDFYDALRFANWLHNGQPVGVQDASTTEDGAYTMIAENPSMGITISRNPGARFFLPDRNEWYKAAYHESGTNHYFVYPTHSDIAPAWVPPTASANTGNYTGGYGGYSEVGSYTGSASPHGSFDQAGNVTEWTDSLVSGRYRLIRGGNYVNHGSRLRKTWNTTAASATYSTDNLGFRVAGMIEEAPALPSSTLPGFALLSSLLAATGHRGLRGRRLVESD